jgi:hypothetical protein
MKANQQTPLVDEYLQSLQGMETPRSDDFFYVRLKARMEKNVKQEGLRIYRPALLIGVLLLLLCVNMFMLVRQRSSQIEAPGSSIQQVAEAYNLGSTSNY